MAEATSTLRPITGKSALGIFVDIDSGKLVSVRDSITEALVLDVVDGVARYDLRAAEYLITGMFGSADAINVSRVEAWYDGEQLSITTSRGKTDGICNIDPLIQLRNEHVPEDLLLMNGYVKRDATKTLEFRGLEGHVKIAMFACYRPGIGAHLPPAYLKTLKQKLRENFPRLHADGVFDV